MRKRKFTVALELDNLNLAIADLIKSSKKELYGNSGEWGLTCFSGWAILSKSPTLIDKWSDALIDKYVTVLTNHELNKIHNQINTIADEIREKTKPDNLEFDGATSGEGELADDVYSEQYPGLIDDFNNRIKLIEQRIDNMFLKQRKSDKLTFTIPITLSVVAVLVSIASFIIGIFR